MPWSGTSARSRWVVVSRACRSVCWTPAWGGAKWHSLANSAIIRSPPKEGACICVWDRFKKDLSSTGAGPAPAADGPTLSAAAEASVRQLMANGKYKVAVETAKEIHKAQATPASEALLVDAYAARIQALVDQNLALEAKALLDLVQERYPSARQRLNERNTLVGTEAGRIEELVRPLNDPALSAEQRALPSKRLSRAMPVTSRPWRSAPHCLRNIPSARQRPRCKRRSPPSPGDLSAKRMSNCLRFRAAARWWRGN